MMGEGIVGGMLLDYVKLGQTVARRTRWVLDGEAPVNAPPADLDSNRPVFDARELERWNIPDSRLPPAGVVRFREPGLWERYRWQLTALLIAGLLQAGLILVLLVERRRRMGAQRLNLAVLDSLPGAVAILDRHGTVLRSSPASNAPLGSDGAPAGPLRPGRRFLESFRELSRDGGEETRGVESLLTEVLSARAHEGVVEFRGVVPDTWFELRARRLDRSEGGAVVSVVDVTPRRSAEREARQARDERAHLERVAAVGELGVSIAHELNQPLAAIRTNAETAQRLLQRTPMDVALLREVLQDIVSDDQRAGEVIRHMRALLKKGGGHTGLHDLNTLVREVLRLVGNDAQLRGVSLTLRLSEDALAVRGDDVQLQQVVLNLTLNALEAVGPRPPDQRRVWIVTRRLEEGVELVVEDSGVGLSDEVLAHLFQHFFTTRSEGLGMGLSISRSILEVHQGRLQAERRAGGGAVFRCILPAA